jgi:hypothetical protein
VEPSGGEPSGGEASGQQSPGGDAPLGGWPVALLLGREESLKDIDKALHGNGFAVLALRKKNKRKSAGSSGNDAWILSSVELDKVMEIFEQTENIDPDTVGIVGGGDGVLPAAALAGGLSASDQAEAQPHGVSSDAIQDAQGEIQRFYVFMLLLFDSWSGEPQDEVAELFQTVQAPLLCLVSEAESGTDADSVREVLLAALDRGANPDYTVKIIHYDVQPSLMPIIDRWLQARF